MGASFSAEFLKLRKRPSTWILALVLVTIVLLFGYLLNYSFVANPPPPPEDLPPPPSSEEVPPELQQAQEEEMQAQMQAEQEAFFEEQLRALLPEKVLSNLFGGGLLSIGSAVAITFGALAAGSEYGWGTLKTVLSQGPGRLSVLSGKLLALALFLAVFFVLTFGAAALGSFVVARLEEAAVNWPPVVDLLRGVGAGALIFMVWGAFGFLLSTLLRGTALAIGLGLAYALAVESIVLSLPFEGDTSETMRKATIGENVGAISNTFGSPFPSVQGFVPEPLVEPERAVLVLSAYAIVFILLTALLLWRRDVT